MLDKHKTPLLGWHPRSAGLEAWIRAEAQRRGSLADVLEEGMSVYRKLVQGAEPRAAERSTRRRGDPPAPRTLRAR